MRVYTKCANYASEYCPCILAEKGLCVHCSMCHGESFCKCSDTVSFCILQELKNNGGKAKAQRPTFKSTVSMIRDYGEGLHLIRLRIPNINTSVFQELGSFVFMRVSEETFYDVPLSVLYSEVNCDSIGLLVQIRGIKTKAFENLKQGDSVYLRGPYFNGLQGKKTVANLHNQKAVVICRGIGFLPSLYAIQSLKSNNNDVKVYLDPRGISSKILDFFKDFFEVEVSNINLCDDKGNLSHYCLEIINKATSDGTALIHLGLSDYLISKAVNHIIDSNQNKIPLSCINNAKMCCGEGICGACVTNVSAQETVHVCREQIDIYNYYRNKKN